MRTHYSKMWKKREGGKVEPCLLPSVGVPKKKEGLGHWELRKLSFRCLCLAPGLIWPICLPLYPGLQNPPFPDAVSCIFPIPSLATCEQALWSEASQVIISTATWLFLSYLGCCHASSSLVRGHWPAIGVVIRESECLPLLYKQGSWLRVEALFQHGAST